MSKRLIVITVQGHHESPYTMNVVSDHGGNPRINYFPHEGGQSMIIRGLGGDVRFDDVRTLTIEYGELIPKEDTDS